MLVEREDRRELTGIPHTGAPDVPANPGKQTLIEVVSSAPSGQPSPGQPRPAAMRARARRGPLPARITLRSRHRAPQPARARARSPTHSAPVSAGEWFADVFVNWVNGTLADNAQGDAIDDWMNAHMQDWIEMA